MFGGLTVVEVEAGTEIEHDGEKLTVTDSSAVRKNGTIYVTAKVFAALKQRSGSARAMEGRE